MAFDFRWDLKTLYFSIGQHMSTHSVADNLLKFYSLQTVEFTRTDFAGGICKTSESQ